MVVDCENPSHKEYLKAFLKKFPSASPDAKSAIIDVNPNDWWAVDLKHPENNTAKCCQMCSITEGIKRITSPGWKGQPAPYDRPYLSPDGEFYD